MALDPQTRRLNRAILKETGGHLPGTINALLAQRDDWETPPDLFRRYHDGYDFTLDPCANAANAVVPRFFDQEENGLHQPWSGARVWLHPPHSEAPLWARKAALESQSRKARASAFVVALLPARTGDGWWHDYVLRCATEIRYLRGTPGFRLRQLPVTADRRPLPIGGFAIVTFDGTA